MNKRVEEAREQELAGYRLFGPGDIQVISRVARSASSRFIGIDHAQTESLTIGRVARILGRIGREKSLEILEKPGYLYRITERQARKVAKKLAGAGGLRGKEGSSDMERVEGSPNYSPFTGEPVRNSNKVGKVGKTHEPMAVGFGFTDPADMEPSIFDLMGRLTDTERAIIAAAIVNIDLEAPKARPAFGNVFLPYADIVSQLSKLGLKTDYQHVRYVLENRLRPLMAEQVAGMRNRQLAGIRYAERARERQEAADLVERMEAREPRNATIPA